MTNNNLPTRAASSCRQERKGNKMKMDLKGLAELAEAKETIKDLETIMYRTGTMKKDELIMTLTMVFEDWLNEENGTKDDVSEILAAVASELGIKLS